MGALTREAILEIRDIKTEQVNVPEWGGYVWVRGMSGAERDRFESEIVLIDKKGKARVDMANIRARMAATCIVDESGKRMFSAADIEALSTKSAGALERVYSVAQRLSGLSEGDLEELEKNSGTAQ